MVNSNISINKIYLEVSIPKIFINNGLTLTTSTLNDKQSNKKDSNTQINDIKIDKFTVPKKNITVKNILQTSSKKETPIKIPPLYENDFNSLKNKKFSSPNNESFLRGLKRNNISGNNQFIPQPCYFSPDYLQMNHPTIFGGVNNISGINTTTNSSSVYFSPNFNQYLPFSPNSLSYVGQNYYMQSKQMINQIKPIEFDSIRNVNFLPRKLSENTYDNMRDTTLGSFSSRSNYVAYNPMNSSLINPNNVSVRSLGKISYGSEDYRRYSGLVNNGYVSPRNDYVNLKSSILGNTTVGPIPTIHKKIMDWEKLNKNQGNEGERGENIKNAIEKTDIGKTNSLLIPIEQNKDLFLSHYEGLNNFLIFLRSSTPYIVKKNIELFVSIII